MKLSDLLKGVKVLKIEGNIDVEVENVSISDREIGKKSLYIAIDGENYDGHDYVKTAVYRGAIAVLVEKYMDEVGVTQIVVDNSRKATSLIASNFYLHPERYLKIIGVTGTNGKTTTSFMIKSVLEKYGAKTAVIGTLGAVYDDKIIETGLTTPDPLILFKILREMVDNKVKYVVMEVSAHAIHFEKIAGITFEVAVFTNLTQDHLDFFGTMDNYKKVKLSYLMSECVKNTVVNNDDVSGRFVSTHLKGVYSYAIDNPADVFAIDVKIDKSGTSFIINAFDDIENVSLKTFGKFNVYNAMSAILTANILGVPVRIAVSALEEFDGVEGRLEKVYDKAFSVFIDYAHTPDGLTKSISALKNLKYDRVICVFGCGGNRDKDKRAKMGKISGELADFTVVTTDNPRFEDPVSIMREVESGLKLSSKRYVLIENRKSAIKYALNYAKKGDAVLIAGKGCEKFQEILGIKQPYEDKEEVEKILKGEIGNEY